MPGFSRRLRMFEKEMQELLKRGTIRRIDLETKRDELAQNQLLLLKDDLESARVLLEHRKYRAAFIHGFDAIERIADIVLLKKGYKVRDRVGRKIAVGNIFGAAFYEMYIALFEKRRSGMYTIPTESLLRRK